MAKVVYTRRALDDLERLANFLLESAPNEAAKTVDLISEAIMVLDHHPLIGPAIDNELRELVISRRRTGYVAIYSYEEVHDTVLILAIRHQREAGY